MTSILSSGLLEVAIGLAFVYLLLSLFCSTVNEWIAGIMGSRAYNLEKGIRSLFTNGMLDNKTSFKDAIYNHGLIQSLYQRGFWDKFFRRTGGPSYIASPMFATTLVNLLLPDGATNASVDSLRAKIDGLPPSKGREALLALVSQGQTSLDEVRKSLEAWYNDGMDRVAGWYKRRTTLVLLCLGLITAISTNTDSFLVGRVLWNNPAMRQATVDAADKFVQEYKPANSPTQSNAGSAGAKTPATTPPAAAQDNPQSKAPDPKQVKETIEKLNSQLTSLQLPVGWPSMDPQPTSFADAIGRALKAVGSALNTLFMGGEQANAPADYRAFPTDTGQAWFRIFGWLFTAAALSLGAPFWFDLLNKFMVVRSTVKPNEKSKPEASKG